MLNIKNDSHLFAAENVTVGSPRKRNIQLSIDYYRQKDIDNLLSQYNDSINLIRSLKKKNTSILSKHELYTHNKALTLTLKKKMVLSNKLLAKGYKTEKRGRPKKDINLKYKTTHTRIGCYFTKSNANYLKQLKRDGLINDISAFLNDLINEYKDGIIDEK
jgi:hypothetical protein